MKTMTGTPPDYYAAEHPQDPLISLFVIGFFWMAVAGVAGWLVLRRLR